MRRWVAQPWLAPLSLAVAILRAMKVRDVIRLVVDDGWLKVRQRGSHRQYRHPTKRGVVTIAGSPSDDIAAGTLNSILKQAGLKR